MAQEKQIKNWNEKVCDWLMDIAKYIITAVLISTVFGKLENIWITCAIAGTIAALLLYFAARLLKKSLHKTSKNK